MVYMSCITNDPNEFRLRTLGYQEISRKSQNLMESKPMLAKSFENEN